tara:strand:- start:4356 stop:5672 length:1317 start_codon:yes stop_codon:yes gene_type:complete
MKKLLNNLRVFSFWCIDWVKGGKIKNHYNDIKFILENYNSMESFEKRTQYLNNILLHATTTTPYYRHLAEFKSLNDFPVINKIIVREKYLEIQSETYLNRPKKKLQTSGSSGTPFTVLHDLNKTLRTTADAIYFSEKSGFQIGNRLYFFRRWTKKHLKSRFYYWATNITIINVMDFSDKYLSHLINTLRKDNSNITFLGYPSAFRDICKYLDKTNASPVKINMSSIIGMGEAISDYVQESMEKYFCIPVLSRYSNNENGILSQQLPHQGNYFHINWATYHIELLHPDKDIPVKHGELGRIVVTDLFNYSMPLIRYDTGDLGIMSDNNPYFNYAPAFTKIEGRKMDILYNTSGQPISSFLTNNMECFPEIKQFQLIQEDKTKYTIKLNIDEDFAHENKLRLKLKADLGDNAELHFDYVNEIPQLSSGKRKLTINNYIKQ